MGQSSKEHKQQWYLANRERIRQRQRENYIQNRLIIRTKQAEYRNANKDVLNSKAAEWRGVNKEKLRVMRAGYRKAHHERYLQRDAAYREKYRDKLNASRREYAKLHPEKERLWSHNKRVRRADVDGYYALEDIQELLIKQKRKCENCKAKFVGKGYEIDHVIPLARGGSNFPDNLQLLCRSCNMRKHAKMPEVWAAENGRLF